ncbi:hypothetical protein Tco_1450614 [Tanacetum coccineum]
MPIIICVAGVSFTCEGTGRGNKEQLSMTLFRKFGLYKLCHTRQSCNNNVAALTRVTEGEPSALREFRLERKKAGDKATYLPHLATDFDMNRYDVKAISSSTLLVGGSKMRLEASILCYIIFTSFKARPLGGEL